MFQRVEAQDCGDDLVRDGLTGPDEEGQAIEGGVYQDRIAADRAYQGLLIVSTLVGCLGHAPVLFVKDTEESIQQPDSFSFEIGWRDYGMVSGYDG